MACKAKDVFHGRSYRKRTKLLCRRGEERQADGEIGFGCGPGHKNAENQGKHLLQVKKKKPTVHMHVSSMSLANRPKHFNS